MDPRRARRLLGIAFVIGVAADLLFDSSAAGINVPILYARAARRSTVSTCGSRLLRSSRPPGWHSGRTPPS